MNIGKYKQDTAIFRQSIKEQNESERESLRSCCDVWSKLVGPSEYIQSRSHRRIE